MLTSLSLYERRISTAKLVNKDAKFSKSNNRIYPHRPGLHGFLIAIVFICLLPAIFEEIFFRGLIQNGLSKKYGDIKSLVIASIMFSLLHLEPSVIFPIFLLSLMLGFVYIKTMNLIYSIILHFMNNLMIVLLHRYDVLQIKGLNTSIEIVEHLNIYYVLSAILATVIISAAIFRIRLSDNKEDDNL